MTFFVLLVSYIFINNMVLTRLLGICPFVGVSKNLESAVGMGLAVTFVMGIASVVTYLIYHTLLTFFGVQDYLDIITFILIIAALVQFVEMLIQKFAPPLYKALGIYLPLITTNCAVLGITLINISEKYSLFESFVAGTSAGLGFLLALILMASVREKLEYANIPKPLQGMPISFITAGLMALVFMAFDVNLVNNLFGG